MDRRIFVMFVEECELNMLVWTRPDLNLPEEDYHLMLGKFVSDSLEAIHIECRKRGMKPCIRLVPRHLTQEEFNRLDKAGWTGEMERLIADVQRNENRS